MRLLVLFLFISASTLHLQGQNVPNNYLSHWNNFIVNKYWEMDLSESPKILTIPIPPTSLDTSGIINCSDTIQYYIDLYAKKASLDTAYIIKLPAGHLSVLKTLNIPSYIQLKGEGSGITVLNCKPGENRHCISITNPASKTISQIPITRHIPRLSDSIYVNKIAFDSISNISKIKYFTLANSADSSLVTSSWARNTIHQHFQLYGTTSDNKEYVLQINAPKNHPLLDPLFSTSAAFNKNSTLLKVLNYVEHAGLTCLTINRLDNTTNQTSNIHLNQAFYCLIKGVESINTNFAHIHIHNSAFNTIKRNRCHHAFSYGGGGKGYGTVLEFGASNNLIIDNIFYHLRHSVLMQAGANTNAIIGNYSFDPYWTEAPYPTDAAGDIVFHGNYPFANVVEMNIVQQIVFDNSHGKNGKLNVVYRNLVQNYGITMAMNGSDSQVLVGNEITGTGGFKGLYIIADNGHFVYGNNVKGTLNPVNSTLDYLPFLWYQRNCVIRRTSIPAFPCFPPNLTVPFGYPYNQNQKTIPAYIRIIESRKDTCFDDISDAIGGFSGVFTLQKSKVEVFPNPATSELNVSIERPSEISILDISGKIIMKNRKLSADGRIDISGLNNGYYIIQITGNDNAINYRKIIVSK